jgi:hypothetical protein
VDRVRAELRFDVAADLVEVDAEGGQQRRGVEAGPVATAGADDEPDRVAGSLGGEAVRGEQPRCFGCLREAEANQQVFHTDVAVPAAGGAGGETSGGGDTDCWCCGQRYSNERVVRLGNHPEAAVYQVDG